MKQIKRRNPTERVIFELGGIQTLADGIDVHRNTVARWVKLGKIPRKYHKPIAHLAAANEIRINAEDLLA